MTRTASRAAQKETQRVPSNPHEEVKWVYKCHRMCFFCFLFPRCESPFLILQGRTGYKGERGCILVNCIYRENRKIDNLCCKLSDRYPFLHLPAAGASVVMSCPTTLGSGQRRRCAFQSRKANLAALTGSVILSPQRITFFTA